MGATVGTSGGGVVDFGGHRCGFDLAWPGRALTVEDRWWRPTAPDADQWELWVSQAPVEPVGVVDIARRLGVRQQTVAMWRYRGLLPDPRWSVSNQPAWDWQDIRRWAESTGRLPGDTHPDEVAGRDRATPRGR